MLPPRALFAAAILLLLTRPLPAPAQVPAEWAADVRALLAAMDSIHPAPYRIHPRAKWERLAAEIEARVPTLRYHQFVTELARLAALAADGHTRLGNIRLADHQRVVVDPGPGRGSTRSTRSNSMSSPTVCTRVRRLDLTEPSSARRSSRSTASRRPRHSSALAHSSRPTTTRGGCASSPICFAPPGS